MPSLGEDVADVRRHGIETYREDERNVFVGATEREQPQNLDFPGSQVVRICDTRVALLQRRQQPLFRSDLRCCSFR